VDGKVIEQVSTFKCFTGITDVEEELSRFLFFCGTTSHTLDRKVCEKMLFKLYKVMVIPSLLCGCETWTCRANEIRTEVAEMQFF